MNGVKYVIGRRNVRTGQLLYRTRRGYLGPIHSGECVPVGLACEDLKRGEWAQVKEGFVFSAEAEKKEFYGLLKRAKVLVMGVFR